MAETLATGHTHRSFSRKGISDERRFFLHSPRGSTAKVRECSLFFWVLGVRSPGLRNIFFDVLPRGRADVTRCFLRYQRSRTAKLREPRLFFYMLPRGRAYLMNHDFFHTIREPTAKLRECSTFFYMLPRGRAYVMDLEFFHVRR